MGMPEQAIVEQIPERADPLSTNWPLGARIVSAGAPPAPTRARRARRTTALALARACRPRQWTKNLLVLAAPAAAGVLFHPEVPGRLALAFVSFCLISSCAYLLNDVHDRAEDERQPAKRTRPIASGEIPVALALAVAVVLALAGLSLAAVLGVGMVGVALGYLTLTGSYTLWWRGVAVADIAAVTGGFILRAIAGGVATGVPVSRWFVIVTSFGALFLVAGKRHAELSTATETSESGESSSARGHGGAPTAAPADRPESRAVVALAPGRVALRAYSAAYLRFVMILAAAVAVGAYCLWAFQRRAQGVSPWYDLTILPFVLWLLRYALLVDHGSGDAPEELALGDGFLLTMSVAWVAIFAGAVYVGG